MCKSFSFIILGVREQALKQGKKNLDVWAPSYTCSLPVCLRSCWGRWVDLHRWCRPMRRGFLDWWLEAAPFDWLTRTSCPHPLPDTDEVREKKKAAMQRTRSKHFLRLSPHCHMTREERGFSWMTKHWWALNRQLYNCTSSESACQHRSFYSLLFALCPSFD